MVLQNDDYPAISRSWHLHYPNAVELTAYRHKRLPKIPFSPQEKFSRSVADDEQDSLTESSLQCHIRKRRNLSDLSRSVVGPWGAHAWLGDDACTLSRESIVAPLVQAENVTSEDIKHNLIAVKMGPRHH